jgi:hypothetical protein
MKTPNGYKAIFCHWDGYPEHVGKMLKEHYNTPKKVEELISLGDIDCLYETIGIKHDGTIRQPPAMTTFANRDLGVRWEDVKPKRFLTFDELKTVASNSWAEFLYVFYPDKKKELEKTPNWQQNYWIKEKDIEDRGWVVTRV